MDIILADEYIIISNLRDKLEYINNTNPTPLHTHMCERGKKFHRPNLIRLKRH